ncbi:MAG: hypothetical protein WCS96_06835 [Victivallales bacterium]
MKQSNGNFKITKKNGGICVKTDSFAFELDADAELKALRWQNHLAGKTLDLGGGSELEVEIDTARQRIWIEGWHYQRSGKEAVAPDKENGFKAGYHLPEYPDIHEHLKDASRWGTSPGLFGLVGDATYWAWARTRLFLPESLKGEPLSFTLGGFGVGDFRHTRVFVNGSLVGERKVEGRWFEPGSYELRPDNPLYEKLRFGQVNILALQLGGAIDRSLRFEEADPAHAYHWPYPHILQPAYFQHIESGESPVRKLTFAVQPHVMESSLEGNGLRVVLAAKEEPITAEMYYRPADGGRTLIKSIALKNVGKHAVRIMNLRLGDYQTGTPVSEGDMGFPVHADDAFFFSLDHPAGWAMGESGRVQLRQFPGVLLMPGQSFSSMNAVLGVAEAGRSQEAFLNHLSPRMRRVRRGHDKPYAITEMFGSWPIPQEKSLGEELSEDVCLRHADWLREFHNKTGEMFDMVSVDFWHDPTADLVKFNHLFPNGFDKAQQALAETGAKYGLWIDSATVASWHIGLNPLVSDCMAGQPSYAITANAQAMTCRAAEPIRSIFKNAFLHHVRGKGARLLKFDNLLSTCHNQCHGHWPGVYSTEAIYDSVIDFFAALDQACPEVFLMLYWGYRSPWWLLHGDMLFECGLKIEAASPSMTPTLYVRDGVAVTLDQGTSFISDVPRLGKDSLGIWLSRWPWNSSIGTERWREGVIMDLCRGNLMFQPWLGEDRLSDDDLHDMARFMRLLRRRPECFINSRLIFGDPWRNEPYGYACSDGKRTFVAVNNFAWSDYPVTFDNLAEFELDPARSYTVFRHYPGPARLSATSDCLRPFQVALYELVLNGEKPSSDLSFPEAPSRQTFTAPTVAVPLEVKETAADIAKEEKIVVTAGVYDAVRESTDAGRIFTVSGETPAAERGGMLVACAVASRAGKASSTGSMGLFFKTSATLNGMTAEVTPVLPGRTYPATWQAWRMNSPAAPTGMPVGLAIACRLSADIRLDFSAYFIPTGG